jgi:hypothetical protein
MKKVIYIIISLVIGILLITCENEPDLREPELQDAVAPYLAMTENSDIYVDLNDPNGFSLEFNVDILFEDPFQKIAVFVVMNGDFENQYMLIDNITSVPQTATITMADIVSAVPGLNAASEIVEGDAFVFFAAVTMPDGSVLPSYTVNGDLAYSSSMVNTLSGLKDGATFDIFIPVPCPFNIDEWPGTYNFYDLGMPSENTTAEVFLDAGVTNGLKIYGMYSVYAEPDTFRIVLHPADFTVSFPEQTISQDLWGYGPGTAQAGSGTFNTCEFSISFSLDVCISLGCWSGWPVILEKQ